jgi:PAS domain S-box-containing protein
VSSRGKIISTNEILRAVTGYSEEDLEKLSAPDFFSGNVDELMTIVHATKAGKMHWENQVIKTKSGGFIPADISAVYLNQGSGLFSLFFRFKESWVQDTNPNAEGSQQELLNYLLKHVSSVMFVINDKLQTEYVSPSITDFTGYSQAEFEIPGFWQSIILPEDFLKISELRKRNKEDNRYNLTFRLKHKNGQLVELNNSGKIIFSEDGPISFTVDIVADFAKIDKKYHEICFNLLSSKYLNKVSFGDNPFSECKPIIKRKWWQFWKSKYIQL